MKYPAHHIDQGLGKFACRRVEHLIRGPVWSGWLWWAYQWQDDFRSAPAGAIRLGTASAATVSPSSPAAVQAQLSFQPERNCTGAWHLEAASMQLLLLVPFPLPSLILAQLLSSWKLCLHCSHGETEGRTRRQRQRHGHSFQIPSPSAAPLQLRAVLTLQPQGRRVGGQREVAAAWVLLLSPLL